VDIDSYAIEGYYEGFSNQTLWPLFHYFPQYATFDDTQWAVYRDVNRSFADVVLEVAGPDDVIWVHDYHLMLLPALIRRELPEASIGYFLHIPFPSFETFRLLPWREELLDGLMGADLVGFHTYDYGKHFLASVRHLLGHDHSAGQINAGRRLVKVDSFPMGIDFERYAESGGQPAVARKVDELREELDGRRLILSVDRLDYSKGLLNRLEVVDRFLTDHPEYAGRIQVIMVAVPSRSAVPEYDSLKRQVDEAVGRINGIHGDLSWTPVRYVYSSLPFDDLTALYNAAEVCLVTPLRDGMNLIAKEYVAAHSEGEGVLVLSEMAGAAQELGEALIVNPNNIAEGAEALCEALGMDAEERLARNGVMQERLRRYNVGAWAQDFVDSLRGVKLVQAQLDARKLHRDGLERMVEDYARAPGRCILLGYDGTLVQVADSPEGVPPDEELLVLLEDLGSAEGNTVVIISGRSREMLDGWFGGLPLGLVAEHGAWSRPPGGEWQRLDAIGVEWKDDFLPILQLFADRTPGSFVEEKEFSLVWHYRRADPELASVRAVELREAILGLTTHSDLGVLEGKGMIEIRHARVNKGAAAAPWLEECPGFVMATGDDQTDKDLFAALPGKAYSLKVGYEPSLARYSVDDAKEVRQVLQTFRAASAADEAASRAGA
jgi:trehalose 6-phosphate synthase/phosphatase